MRARNQRHPREQGFTLLEVMIALAVLAMSLTGLIVATGRAIDAENHGRLVTQATMLARYCMTKYEMEAQKDGFPDDGGGGAKPCEFDEAEAAERFGASTYEAKKPPMPDLSSIQTLLGGGAGGQPGGTNTGTTPTPPTPTTPPPGGIPGATGTSGAGMTGGASGILEMVRPALENAIRLVTVKIVWKERGKDQSIEISQFITSPRDVDKAMAGAPK